MHGSHRIVTENTLFAMPEASTSFFLPSLLDCFGVYLALTGTQIQWGDCLNLGLATHTVLEVEFMKPNYERRCVMSACFSTHTFLKII
ncbi:hypothetical protein Q648_00535 [Bartonella quintana JK 12]|uniref:3-hydroxyisobutyryl-CoA hydrolase n=1 Tax=Bartonella quintana JK 68 TaxID=1134503 RepID=A0ABR4SR87_BARQI|nr:hypothetical protein Q647_00946 [Bartonella quintana JK 7]ETS18834.1 hypothetical protein Q648_00535 [Bartonella quintana JK 12]KEC61643.1 hypothetical protein O7Y_00946 [Bartonella quintana JK 63]KEC64544.1 hypothetical protein O7W_00936 [Bartonella quintana JK 56]KEC67042.1 hypothetical protein O7U_00316 [Bartonella quintana JK 68]KEC67617.1 hypothetical protein O7S_00517 [Bartonella quintana JK 67]SQF95820.1 3-hydroxyisobutyryl-CoA hydrolase [Bartonella quintana]